MPKPLSPKQQRFVQEYCIDINASRAAIASGYTPKTAYVQGSRLLRNAQVQAAIAAIQRERAERLSVSADRVIAEYAKVAFANSRDYAPRKSAEFDIHDLDPDRSAAVQQIEFDDVVDKRTGEVTRRTKVRLYDKVAALNGLAKCLGLSTERHIHEGSIEHIVRQMSAEERVERVKALRLKAEREYLPAYRAMMVANGSPVIDETAVHGAAAAADDQPVVGAPAAQPEPTAGLGSELPVNGGGHVDQARRAAREEILGPVDADQTSGWQMWPGHNPRR